MKKTLYVLIIVILAILVSADPAVSCGNGGMGGGMGGGMMMGDMGSSMFVVADDGSILVIDGGMGMMGGWSSSQPTLTRISPSGDEGWQMPFSSGSPMMPATVGDLVVVVVSSGGWGMGGWGMWGGSQGSGQSWILGIDLASGNLRFQINLDNSMASYPQFSDDGLRFYVTVSASGGQMYGGPMDQGGWGSGMTSTSTILAIDRNGNVLWERDLGGQGGGWSP